MLSVLINAGVTGSFFVHFGVHRLGLCGPPTVDVYFPRGMRFARWLFGWDTHLRIVGEENCPSTGPAVFAGNHMLIFDPGCMFAAIHRASREAIRVHFMMRDDFFPTNNPITRWYDLNEVTRMLGAIQINRESVRHAQLKPFVGLLREGACFLMYPGRTRSRSGCLMEYRKRFGGPGSVAFFLAKAQQAEPGLLVQAIPTARTYNPVKKSSTVVFGCPMVVDGEVDRAGRAAFDSRFIVAMSGLLELNAAHIISALLYLQCLHQGPLDLEESRLTAALEAVAKAAPHPYMDPGLTANPAGEVRATLRYLAKARMLKRRNGAVTLLPNAILETPRLDTAFRKRNPVRYLTNQIVHLGAVAKAVEAASADHLRG